MEYRSNEIKAGILVVVAFVVFVAFLVAMAKVDWEKKEKSYTARFSYVGGIERGSLVRFGTVQFITNGHETHRKRYHIALSRPVAGLEAQFDAIEGLEVISIDRLDVEVEYSSEVEQAAELLARLVRQQLPIAAFAPASMDLEQAYLQTGIRQVD